MFRLVKLEDRIVLDGAAILDAFEQAQENELHAQEAQDHADDAVDDASDDSADHAFDTDEPLYADTPDTDAPDEGGLHVLVISSDIKDGDTLAAAAKDDILVIRYDAETTNLDDLAGLINDALDGEKADSIAFATHNSGTAEVQLTHDSVASLDALANDADQQAFWKNIGGMLDEDGRIDLLACNVAETTDGEHLVAGIENISGAHVAASTDLTGSEAYGGDWVLESGDVDVQETYFDAHRLDSYDGVLAPPTVINPIADQIWPYGKTGMLVVQTTATFTDPDGDSLTYSIVKDSNFANMGFIPYNDDLYIYGMATASGIYTVDIIATDPAGNTVADEFKVTVPPASEYVPVYSNPPVVTISEAPGITNGTVIGTYTASDANAGDKLTYSVVTGSGDPMAVAAFDINPSTGAVYVKNASALDYEAYTAGTPNGIRLVVMAQDDSAYTLGDTAVITIRLTDVVNENPSKVTLDLSSTQFSEDGGTLQVNAFNVPADTSGPVTVSLQFPSGGANEASYGADFSGSDVIVIPTGQTAGTPVTLTGIPDTDVEGNESVNIKIGGIVANNATAATDTYTATLTESVKPNVRLGINGNTFAEKNGIITLSASLDQSTNVPVTVPLVFTPAATNGADFGTDYRLSTTSGSPTGQQIVIPANAYSASILIAGNTDMLEEMSETFSVSMGSVTGAIKASPSNYNLTITDSTPPIVTLAVSSSTVTEGEQTIITANLSEKAVTPTTILVDLNGTAVSPSDFGVYNTDGSAPLMSGTHYKIEIPAGASQGSLVMKTVQDGVFEGFTPETVGATIFYVEQAIVATDAVTPIISIIDKDAANAPQVEISVSGSLATSGSFSEINTSTLSLDVTLDKPVGVTVGVALDVKDVLGDAYYSFGTEDFTASVGGTPVPIVNGQIMVTVPKNATLVTLDLNGVGDLKYEGTEVSAISIAGVTNAVMATAPGANTSVVATLNDLTAKPTLTLAMAGTDTDLHESLATAGDTVGMNLTVTPSAGTTIEHPMVVDLSVSGSATYLSDYTAATQGGSQLALNAENEWEITTPAGQTAAQTFGITLGVKDDILAEQPTTGEVITVGFGNNISTQGLTLNGSPQNVTIIDDEAASNVTLTMSVSPSNISETGASNTAVMTFDLSAPLSGNTVAKLALPGTEAALGADYTLELASGITGVTLATSDNGTPADQTDDYATLTFSEAVTTATVNVIAVNDGLYEGTSGEDINIDVTSPVPGAFNVLPGPSTTIHIEGDDSSSVPKVSLGVSRTTIGESSVDLVLVSANLDAPTTQDVSVEIDFRGVGTASAGPEDYNAPPATLVIPAGQTTAEVPISVVDDKWLENDETFEPYIISVSGSAVEDTVTANPVITIIDDDINGNPQIKLVLGTEGDTFVENPAATIPPGYATEGTLKVIMDRPVSSAVTVDLNFGGSASTADYTVEGQQTSTYKVVFAPNATEATVHLRGVDDSLGEITENVGVTLGAISGGDPAKPPQVYTVESSQTLRIYDDEGEATIQSLEFVDNSGVSANTFKEGETVKLVATLTKANAVDITIPLNFDFSTAPDNGGKAEPGDIATVMPPQIVITAGATSGELIVAAVNEGAFEKDEILSVSVVTTGVIGISTDAVAVAIDTSDTITIEEGSGKPEVSLWFTTGDPTVTAGGTDGIIIEDTSVTDGGILIVSMETSPDVSGTDDVVVSVEVSPMSNAYPYGTNGFYLVPMTDPTSTVTVTGNEFDVTFTNGVGGTQGFYVVVPDNNDTTGDGGVRFALDGDVVTGDAGNTANDLITVTIVDDDYTAPSASVAFSGWGTTSGNLSENPAAALTANPGRYIGLEVSLSSANPTIIGDAIVRVQLGGQAVAGTDYEIRDENLDPVAAGILVDGMLEFTISAGSTASTYYLRGIDDSFYEGNELITAVVVTSGGEHFATAGMGSIYEANGKTAQVVDYADVVPTVTLNAGGVGVTVGMTEGGGVGNPTVGGTAGMTLSLDKDAGLDTTVTMNASYYSDGDYTITVKQGLEASGWASDTAVNIGSTYVHPTSGAATGSYFKMVQGWDLDGDGTISLSTGEPDWAPGGITDAGTEVVDGEVVWVNMGEVNPTVQTDGSAQGTFSVVVPRGESDVDLIIQAVTDTTKEADEAVLISLVTSGVAPTAASSYTYGASDTSGSVTIIDDDKAPDYFVTIDPVSESEGVSVDMTVGFSGPAQGVDIDIDVDFVAAQTNGAIFGGLVMETGTVYEAGDIVVIPGLGTGGDHYFEVIAGGSAGDFTAADVAAVIGGSFGVGDSSSKIALQDMGVYDYFADGTDISHEVGGDGFIVTIQNGQTAADDIQINFATDSIFEATESFTVLSPDATAGSSTVVNIIESYGSYNLGFSATNGSFNEEGSNTSLFVKITADHPASADTQIVVQFTGGAEDGTGKDYLVLGASSAGGYYTVTLPAGQTETSQLTLFANDDNIFEGTAGETLGIQIVSGTIDFSGGQTVAAVAGGDFLATLNEPGDRPEFQLVAATDSFLESSGQATVALQISNGKTLAPGVTVGVDVLFATEGTAAVSNGKAGFYDGAFTDGDYKVSFGGATQTAVAASDGYHVTVTMGSGTSTSFVMSGVTDNLVEGSETVVVSLATVSATSSYTISTMADFKSDTVTVLDSNPAPTVKLDLTTPFSDPGIDPDDKIFLEGTSLKYTDTAFTTATVGVSLEGITNAADQARDITVPLVFGDIDADNDGTADFTVWVNGVNQGVAVSGGTVNVVITAGSTETDVMLKANDPAGDGYEGDNGYAISMNTAGIVGAAASTVAAERTVTPTIWDMDTAPVVSLSIYPTPDADQIGESGGITFIRAELTQTVGQAVTVNLGYAGVASVGADYTPAANTITIPAGQTSALIKVTGKDDLVYEGNEAFEIYIANVTTGNARIAPDVSPYDTSGFYETGNQVMVTDSSGNEYFFQLTSSSGQADSTPPDWDFAVATLGATILDTDTGLAWQNMGRVDIGSIPAWDAGAQVSAGEVVTPGNGYYYVAVSTSGNAETDSIRPVWSTTPGATIADGGVVWKVQAKGALSSSLDLTVIENDAGPTVSITPAGFTLGEDSVGTPAFADAVTHGAITVKLSATSAVAETVYLTHEDAGLAYPAEYGTDYGLYYDVAGTDSVVTAEGEVLDGERYLKVEIPAFATGATLHFVNMTDDIFEGDGTPTGGETAHLSIDHFGNGGVTANTAADDVMVTIVDNDLANARTVGLTYDLATITDTAITVTEGDTAQVVMAYAFIEGGLTANTNMQVTFHVDTAGTAVYGTSGDFVIAGDADGQDITVTIPVGASYAEIPITILNDDMLEFTEGFNLKLDKVLGGITSAQNELTGTIYDNPDTNISITLNPNLGTSTVVPAADAWAAGLTVSEGDVLAANGWDYELFFDGRGTVLGDGDTVTTGATLPVTAAAGDHVEYGDTGTGLYWQNVGTHEGLIYNGGVYDVATNDQFVLAATDGNYYLVQVSDTNMTMPFAATAIETIGANAGDVATVTFGGFSASFVNLGTVGWSANTSYEQGDVVVGTDGGIVVALDDGISSAGSIALPTTVGNIVRDGDTNKPMLWEAVGPIANGIVDETDEAMNNVPFFVIKNDNQSENGVIVTWELEAGYTAVAGDGVTAPADYDFSSPYTGVTSGQVQLGSQDNASAYIRLTIPGDQYEETGGTLPIRITGVYEIDPATGSAGASYTTGVTVDTVYNAQAASLTITDTTRDPDISQTTGDMIIPPDASPVWATESDLIITPSEGFVEDGVATITMSDLLFTDADHYVPGNTDSASLADPSDIDVVISAGPTAGVLFLDMNSNGVFDSSGDTMLTAGDSFNLLQVSQGMVKYDHTAGDLGQMVDSFTFTVTDGSNIAYTNGANLGTSGTPFTFTFSAGEVNDAPSIYSKDVLWMAEGTTGLVYEDKGLAQIAGPVIIDPETTDFTTQITCSVQVATGSLADMDDGIADGWAPLTSGSPFNVNAAGQLVVEEPLDYEAQYRHTIHIRAFDGSSTGESYLSVLVVDQDEVYEFDTGIDITDPADPIVKGQTWIFAIGSDVFKKGENTVAEFTYWATPQNGPNAGNAIVLPWLSFNNEDLSFIYSSSVTGHDVATEPTQYTTYTIEVKAAYKWGNNADKPSVDAVALPEVIKSFTLEYTLASLELDMMMDALDYLEQSTDVELPADGEAIEVQEMMMVAQAPADYPAQDASAEAADDYLGEFADVLALLEGEELAQPEDGDIA